MMFPHPAMLEDGTHIGVAVCEFDLVFHDNDSKNLIEVQNFAVEQLFLEHNHENCARAAIEWIERNDPELVS